MNGRHCCSFKACASLDLVKGNTIFPDEEKQTDNSVKIWSHLLPPLCYYLRCEILSCSHQRTKRACSAVKLYLFCSLFPPPTSSFPHPLTGWQNTFFPWPPKNVALPVLRWSSSASQLNNQVPSSALPRAPNNEGIRTQTRTLTQQ